MYTKTTWVNRTAPYLEALNLNHMEKGIFDNSNAIDAIGLGETAKGEWTPTAGTEYPTSPTLGDSYFIAGLSTPYIFAGGDLSGETTDNQDKIYYSDSGWILVEQRNIPTDIAKYVETMGDLSSVDINTYTVAIVKEDGRGGTFVYDPALSGVNNGGTITNGWVRQYNGSTFAEWFGVAENNSDNTSYLQLAIDEATLNSGTIKFDNDKVYAFTTQLELKSNITLDIGSTTIDFSDNPSSTAWLGEGYLSAEYNATGDFNSSDTILKMADTTGRVPGQWLLLLGDKGVALDEAGGKWRLGETTAGTNTPYFGEPIQVKEVISGTDFEITQGLVFDNYKWYGTSDTLGSRGTTSYRNINFIENVTIKGGTFIAYANGDLASDTGDCIRFNTARMCRVIDSKFKLGYMGVCAVRLYRSLHCSVAAHAERPGDWEIIVNHSYYNSYKDVGCWYCTWDVSDLYGCQGFDQTFISGDAAGIMPTLKMHSVSAKQDGSTTHGCVYGGKYDIQAYGARSCGFRNRARYADITVHATGDGVFSLGGLIFSGWGGLDTVIHDSFISGFGYGFEYSAEGVTDTAPPEMNFIMENTVIRDCTQGSAIWFRDRTSGTLNENTTPANVRLKDITIENCMTNGIVVGDYNNSFLIDDINITRIGQDTTVADGLYISNEGAGHDIRNIHGFDIGYHNPDNILISIPWTSSGDAYDRFGYTALVNWESCGMTYFPGSDLGIFSAVSFNTGIYKSVTDYSPTLNDLGQIVKLNSSSAITVTIKEVSNVPRDGAVVFMQYGNGQITFVPENGTVTLNTPDGNATKGKGSIVTLVRTSNTDWSVSGSMV